MDKSAFKFERKITELQGAVITGPNHFARTMNRGLKADRYLQCLDKASAWNPNLKMLLGIDRQPPLELFTLL